ncbi:hypothetical protein COTS27_01660 [Spirochaetota bacterium]|nr:hypothetical protein COTS27_01660 [Spirochaetota bacterium]
MVKRFLRSACIIVLNRNFVKRSYDVSTGLTMNKEAISKTAITGAITGTVASTIASVLLLFFLINAGHVLYAHDHDKGSGDRVLGDWDRGVRLVLGNESHDKVATKEHGVADRTAADTASAHKNEIPKHKGEREIAAGKELAMKSHHAQGPQAVIKKELEEVGIEEKVGNVVSGDVVFTNRLGEKIALETLLAENKPILLSFFYATCPSLCQYVLNAKTETLAKLGLKLGQDYYAVSVSFDKRDTPKLMEASYQNYMTIYNGMTNQYKKSSVSLSNAWLSDTWNASVSYVEGADSGDRVTASGNNNRNNVGSAANNNNNDDEFSTTGGTQVTEGAINGLEKREYASFSAYMQDEKWLFLRGNELAIQKLTRQLGFLFKRVTGGTEDFAHTAAMYVITPNGKISRYFYGLLYPPFDVKMAVLEAKQEKERTTFDRILLYCYRYDADEKGYVLYARNIMKAGGVAIIVFIAALIGMLFRMEKKNQTV